MDMFLSVIINKQRKIKETRKERISLLSRMDYVGLEVRIKLRLTFVTKRLLTEQKWKYPEKLSFHITGRILLSKKKKKQKQKQFRENSESSLFIIAVYI